MTQFHSLRLAAGTRGVDESEAFIRVRVGRSEVSPRTRRQQIFELEDAIVVPEILRPHRDQVLEVRELWHQLLEQMEVVDAIPLFDGDRTGRLRVAQHVLKLRRRKPWVQRDHDRTQLRGREHGQDELRTRGKHNRHPVPGLYAEIGKRGRHRLRSRLDLPERVDLLPEAQIRAPWIRRCSGRQRRRNREVVEALAERHGTSGGG